MNADSPSAHGDDVLLPLSQVPRLKWLPRRRRGARIAFATIWRWSKHGVRGVKLRTVSVGDTMCTTEPWLHEFFEILGAAKNGETPIVRNATPSHRERRHRDAERGLARMGIH